MHYRWLVAAAVLVALALAGPAQAAAPKVSVKLNEFKVIPKPKSVKGGKVTFTAKNTGSIVHELVVLRTKAAPSKLKTSGAKAVEKGRVGKVQNIKPGKTKKLTLKLKKGKYVLLCNVPGHYQAGQRIGFVVK